MGFLEERDLSNVPTIPEYYKGKKIFITGGTGFMGKILIEKLLYSCTDLDKIYLLLRPKKGVSPEKRLEDMYSIPCFDRLRKERPGVFEAKVSVIAGDITDIGLGISKEDRELIIENVNIIFHAAASVRFDDHLAAAAKVNIHSAVEIVEIAKEMKQLEVLVHVSTSYANTDQNPVEEVVYPAHADWRETLAICKSIDEKTLSYLTPKYIGSQTNTYVFTKQLAEHVIYEQKGKLPVIIIRPSVVVSSISEPVSGWIENFNGPVGILIGIGTGILRTLYTDIEFSADYVPVDVCIRHFIAAAWIRGTKPIEATDDIPIYNCCSNKKVSHKLLLKYGKEVLTDIPLDKMLWTADCTMTTSKYFYYVLVLFTHILPAIFVDTLLLLAGRKAMLLKLQRRVFTANIAVQKFLLVEFAFKVDNFKKLRSCLKKSDLDEFYYDFKELATMQHFVDSVWGCKKYLLKDFESLEKLKTKARRFDDHLAAAAKVNIHSAVEIVEIAKEMKQLEVLVHVSTSYANTDQNPVEEVVYPAHADWRETLAICKSIDEKTLSYLTPKYIGSQTNTYVFTKQLAEHVIYEQKGKLPVIIIRPSVVVSSISEPVSGWIENFNGPVGILIGIGTGILRTLYTDIEFSADYVPVDVCIRHFIAAAWIRGTKPIEATDDIPIYNCCSNKKVSHKLLLKYGKEVLTDIPLDKMLWTADCTMTTSKYFYYVLVLFTHILPAIFVDTLLLLAGRKAMLLKLQRRVFTANIAVQKFLLVEFAFKVDNFKKLRSCLKKSDLDEFYYDFKELATMQHFVDSVWGCKKYLLKDFESLEKLKTKARRIQLADKIIRYLFYGFLIWTLAHSNFVNNMYQSLIN